MTIMKTASQTFTEESRMKIRDAVAFAEKKTSGEIVPVAATASGRYDRAEDIFGFLVAIVTLGAAWLLFGADVPAGDFDQPFMTTRLSLPVALILLVVSFSAGAALATWFPWLRLPFITKTEMTMEVERAAAAAFHSLRVSGAKSRTGVLIYVSLYERMVRVIADEAIANQVDQSVWEEVVRLVVNGMVMDSPAEGFAAAIHKSGEILSGPFPRPADDVDEISNELRLLD